MVALHHAKADQQRMHSLETVPVELLVHVPDAPDGTAHVRLTLESPGGASAAIAPARCERLGPCEFHARFDVPRGAHARFRITFADRALTCDDVDQLPAIERSLRADCGSLLLLTLDSAPISGR